MARKPAAVSSGITLRYANADPKSPGMSTTGTAAPAPDTVTWSDSARANTSGKPCTLSASAIKARSHMSPPAGHGATGRSRSGQAPPPQAPPTEADPHDRDTGDQQDGRGDVQQPPAGGDQEQARKAPHRDGSEELREGILAERRELRQLGGPVHQPVVDRFGDGRAQRAHEREQPGGIEARVVQQRRLERRREQRRQRPVHEQREPEEREQLHARYPA